MATESNLQKIHVFPSEESYEQNQNSIGVDDIAFIPDESSESGVGIPVVTTGGTGAAYTATVPGVTELTDGMLLVIIPKVSNTQPRPTLNVNGLGAIPIERVLSFGSTDADPGDQPGANWINAGMPYLLMYSASGLPNGWWINVQATQAASTDIYVASDTNYTTSQVRGISLQTSKPSSIKNGCIVGVYST